MVILFFGIHLYLEGRCCENPQRARGFVQCKTGSAKTWLVSVTIYCSSVARGEGGTGKTVSILVKTFFFFGDYLILAKQPPQSDSRLMKIWVKFIYCCFQLPTLPHLCEFLATRLIYCTIFQKQFASTLPVFTHKILV